MSQAQGRGRAALPSSLPYRRAYAAPLKARRRPCSSSGSSGASRRRRARAPPPPSCTATTLPPATSVVRVSSTLRTTKAAHGHALPRRPRSTRAAPFESTEPRSYRRTCPTRYVSEEADGKARRRGGQRRREERPPRRAAAASGRLTEPPSSAPTTRSTTRRAGPLRGAEGAARLRHRRELARKRQLPPTRS